MESVETVTPCGQGKIDCVQITHSLLASEQEFSKHEAKDKDEYGRMDVSPNPIHHG